MKLNKKILIVSVLILTNLLADNIEIECDTNNTNSCASIGIEYQTGTNGKVDYDKARLLYKKSCENKDNLGCSMLGHLYVKGLGVKIDNKKAIDYYVLSCSYGNPYMCNHLGERYEKGVGVRYDYDKALNYYTLACDDNYAKGCFRLASLKLQDKKHTVDTDKVITLLSKSKELFGKECDRGIQEGCNYFRDLKDY